MTTVRKLTWDFQNVDHIKKHNLTVAEVEKAMKDANLKTKAAHSGRLMLLGRSGDRLLAIVVFAGDSNRYYVVTARDMDGRERKFYRDQL